MRKNVSRIVMLALLLMLGVGIVVSQPQTPSTSMPSAKSAATSLLDINSATKDQRDRKSTRLNSSHQIISYAVFCLKKKNNCQSILLTPGQLPEFTDLLD